MSVVSNNNGSSTIGSPIVNDPDDLNRFLEKWNKLVNYVSYQSKQNNEIRYELICARIKDFDTYEFKEIDPISLEGIPYTLKTTICDSDLKTFKMSDFIFLIPKYRLDYRSFNEFKMQSWVGVRCSMTQHLNDDKTYNVRCSIRGCNNYQNLINEEFYQIMQCMYNNLHLIIRNHVGSYISKTWVFDKREGFCKIKGDVSMAGSYNESNKLGIDKLIYTPPTTYVKWTDGSETTVSCMEGEQFSKEIGLAMAISKKFFGNENGARAEFKKVIENAPVYKNKKEKKAEKHVRYLKKMEKREKDKWLIQAINVAVQKAESLPTQNNK